VHALDRPRVRDSVKDARGCSSMGKTGLEVIDVPDPFFALQAG
jgi:hypothetical protein